MAKLPYSVIFTRRQVRDSRKREAAPAWASRSVPVQWRSEAVPVYAEPYVNERGRIWSVSHWQRAALPNDPARCAGNWLPRSERPFSALTLGVTPE
jgi:hypothetical protein